MIQDYNKYSIIENVNLGKCHVLDKNEKNYLIYCEKNREHFIICDYITTDGNLYLSRYFSNLQEAQNLYDIQKDDSKSIG